MKPTEAGSSVSLAEPAVGVKEWNEWINKYRI